MQRMNLEAVNTLAWVVPAVANINPVAAALTKRQFSRLSAPPRICCSVQVQAGKCLHQDSPGQDHANPDYSRHGVKEVVSVD